HADNGTCLQIRDSIGEVAHVIAQELQTREVSIEAIYAAARAAVDRQRSLLDRRARQARRRPPHRWWAWFAVMDSHAGRRRPAIHKTADGPLVMFRSTRAPTHPMAAPIRSAP